MTQEFVTLPRHVAEHAVASIEMLNAGKWTQVTALTATLRTALEQPQAEQPAMTPIAQRKLEDLVASGYTISGYSIYHKQKHQHGFVTGAGLVGWWKPEGVGYPQPLGEQEPVGFVRQIDIEQIAKTPSDWGAMFGRAMGFNTVPVYTHPQPKREPLTDEQEEAAFESYWRKRQMETFPPDYDQGRLSQWAMNFKADARKAWFARVSIEHAHNIK